jgi:hypothetical protein
MAEKPEPNRSPTTVEDVLVGAVNALRPYGPTPIVSVVLGGTGMIALSVGAPPLAVIGLAVVVFGAYLFGQERKAKWLRAELEATYDGYERTITRDVRQQLERRLQLPGNQGRGTLEENQGDGL